MTEANCRHAAEGEADTRSARRPRFRCGISGPFVLCSSGGDLTSGRLSAALDRFEVPRHAASTIGGCFETAGAAQPHREQNGIGLGARRYRPVFHDGFSSVWDKEGSRIEEARSHGEKAVLIDDIDVSLEWGFTWSDGRDEDWPWANGFPDQKAQSFWADIFYRGALVDRVRLVSVDGGRAHLPTAGAVRNDGGDPGQPAPSMASYDWYVDDWDYDVARVINSIQDLDFHQYFRGARLKRGPRPVRT